MVFCCRVLAWASWAVVCRMGELYQKLSSHCLLTAPLTLVMPEERAAGGTSMPGPNSTADPELKHTKKLETEMP